MYHPFQQPIIKVTKLFTEFFDSEKGGGYFLIGCTFISMLIANSVLGEHYHHIWETPLGGKSLEFWINDGLMTFFFLLVGLEIERELYIGELKDWRNAFLPVLAAIGGMIVPAVLYMVFNLGTPMQNGFGVPMATDIAFSLGILSLLGSRVPFALKVFLTALAIIDDLGAILIIAIFYSNDLQWNNLLFAGLLVLLLMGFNRLKIGWVSLYLMVGAGIWYFLYQAGIHPTITGVLVAFAIPFGDGKEKSPSYRLQHHLHKPVAFVVLPLFALANTAIAVNADVFYSLSSNMSLGIITGLFLGKPLGILLFVLAGLSIGLISLPEGMNKAHIFGAGILAGIGFTMSIFIALLAFDDHSSIVTAKLAILMASILAGIVGYLWLRWKLPKEIPAEEAAAE